MVENLGIVEEKIENRERNGYIFIKKKKKKRNLENVALQLEVGKIALDSKNGTKDMEFEKLA